MCVRSNLYNDRCFPIAHNDHNQPVLRRHPRHCIRLSDGTEEPGAPFNRHSSVFRLRNRQGAFPGTDTQAVVSPGTASRSSHPRFTGRHGTRMSPATVGTGILPPRNNTSAHREGAFACCFLLWHKNETIPHITDMQDHSLHVTQSCPTKKALRKGPRERKTETEPWVSFRYVSICYGVLWFFRSPISSSPFAPCCISMRQYKDTQSFRQKQIFYSICVGGVIYRTRRNPSGRTIPPAPPLPAGRL